MPLRDEMAGIGERIVAHFAAGGEPPFILYQYAPADEWAVRRNLGELRRWLEAAPRQVACAPVSLADLFWRAIEQSGFLDEIIVQEREAVAASNPDALREVHESVGEILRQPPTLPDRVVAEVEDCDERTAVFLYRAGVLFPAYRTSTCGCRKLCRGWSGGIAVLVDESVTAGRFDDLEVEVVAVRAKNPVGAQLHLLGRAAVPFDACEHRDHRRHKLLERASCVAGCDVVI